jgi:hypothetical protein
MTLDARGVLWLDNPLLVFGLLSLLWVLLASLHAEPWRHIEQGGPSPASPTRGDEPVGDQLPTQTLTQPARVQRWRHEPMAGRERAGRGAGFSRRRRAEPAAQRDWAR